MTETTQTTLRGVVVRLFHQSPGFCAGKLRPIRGQTASHGEVSFAGKVFVREGELVCLAGEWTEHQKYGRQWTATGLVYEQDISQDGLAAWLSSSGEARGIGPAKARLIAREFGDNFAGWLRDNPEQIAIAASIPLEDVQSLAKSWLDRQEFNAVATQLAPYGLSESQIVALFDRFKTSIVNILAENPYLVIPEVEGFGFKRADAIAQKLGTPKTHPGRIEAAIFFALSQAANDGSTCLPMTDLLCGSLDALGDDSEALAALVTEAVDRLVAAKKLASLKASHERTYYATNRLFAAESAVADFFRRAAQPNPHFADGVSDRVAGSIFDDLDDSQRRAVELAASKTACLISGGAGAGKSFVIARIAKLYRKYGLTVAMAAPTGKAARRIEEIATGFDASTIHRLLGYSYASGGGVFTHDEHNPIEAHVVIIDEASMLDANLASSLFRAIGPKTALVLVGDHHQLPPVGPGAILRDAIKGELLPLALLAQCHRQAGPLKRNCQAILLGTVAPTEAHESGDAGPWYVHKGLHQPGDVLAYIENRLLGSALSGKLGFDLWRDVQFLSPVHAGPLGTQALNILLQRIRQRELGVTAKPPVGDRKPEIMIHDRVIQTRNDYKLMVMNGHQGTVVATSPDLVVNFDGREVVIPADCRGNVSLAYCLTPHKYQGSEIPCAVVIAHKINQFMLHRNWLYTACTRAKKTCVILGDPVGVQRAAERVVNNRRVTLLPALME